MRPKCGAVSGAMEINEAPQEAEEDIQCHNRLGVLDEEALQQLDEMQNMMDGHTSIHEAKS